MPRPGTPPPDTGVRRPSPSRQSATLLPPFARWWSPTGAAAVALLLLLAAATTGPLPLAASRLTVTSPRARQLPPQLALKPRLFTPTLFPPIPLPPYLAPRNASLPSPGLSGSLGSSAAASATTAAAPAPRWPSPRAGLWVWTHTQCTQAARDVGSTALGVPSWWTAPEWGDERPCRQPRLRSPSSTPLPPCGSLAPLRCQAEDLRCSPPLAEGFEARVPPASPAPAIELLLGPRHEILRRPPSP